LSVIILFDKGKLQNKVACKSNKITACVYLKDAIVLSISNGLEYL